MINTVLVSTAYFGPIPYYSAFVKTEQVYIEQFENFIKQTYRNRCVILGGNGPIQLIVPVVKGRGPKTLIKDLGFRMIPTGNATTGAPFFRHTAPPLFLNITKTTFNPISKPNTNFCSIST
jgi:hypothetical protein